MAFTDLEMKCWTCDGNGVVPPIADDCPTCKGVGSLLTLEGSALLFFLKKHLPNLTDELNELHYIIEK